MQVRTGGVSLVICWAEEGVGGGGATARREDQDPLEGDPMVWTLPWRSLGGQKAPGGLCGLSICLAASCFGLSLCLCRSLSLRFSHCLSQPLSSSLILFLGSSPLHEMSVRDKNTRKNSRRVGRKRGQGPRTAEHRDRR